MGDVIEVKRQGLAGRDDPIPELSAAVTATVRGIERLRHRVAQETNIGGTEVRALARFADRRQMTPKCLAGSLEMTTGAVTAVTDKLVTVGLMERVPNPDDRRSILLRLSADGVDLMDRMLGEYHDSIRAATAGTSPELLRELTAVLLRMSESIESHEAQQAEQAHEAPDARS